MVVGVHSHEQKIDNARIARTHAKALGAPSRALDAEKRSSGRNVSMTPLRIVLELVRTYERRSRVRRAARRSSANLRN